MNDSPEERELSQRHVRNLPMLIRRMARRVRRGELAEPRAPVADRPLTGIGAELHRARERAEVLRQRAPIGIIEWTPDGVLTSANAAFGAMLGYRPDDLIGRSVSDLADPADLPEVDASVRVLRAGTSYAAERRYVSADGRSIPVYISTAALLDEDAAAPRLTGFVVDMSEVHAQRAALTSAVAELAAARDELVRRQSFTDALLETVDVGIACCDVDGRIVVRNRVERALLGVPEGHAGGAFEVPASGAVAFDLTGRLRDVLGESGEPVTPSQYPLARALRAEPPATANLRIGPIGGPYRDIVSRGSQITASDGTVAGAVVTLSDVTAERVALHALAAETEQMSEAQRLGQLGSFNFDVRTGRFSFSDEIYRIWGLPHGADLAALRAGLIHPDDLKRVMAGWDDAQRSGGEHAVEFRINRPDGTLRHLRVALEVFTDAAGEAVSVHGTHLDVTDLARAQRDAVEAGTLFQAILTASPDYTFVTDLGTGAVVYGSPGKTVLGITTGQLEKLGPDAIGTLIHPDEQPRIVAANQAARGLADGEVSQIRYQARHADGSWHWLSRRVTPFRRDETSGEVREILGVIRDVTEVVEAEQRLTHTALHDPLTGLPNRALLMDRLAAALARAGQTKRDVAILFCDLDGFKRVNDTAGHAAGDAVLLETAARLTGVLRDYDTVARVGGDEFVIVVEPWDRRDPPDGADAAGANDAGDGQVDERLVALHLAERITDALRAPITVNDVEHVVTVSIGLTYAGANTSAAAGANTADAVLQDADAAMYRAKKGGKDRVEVFEHGLRADLAERGRVERVLRRALAADDQTPSVPNLRTSTLSAAYQPIVDLETDALVGFEALARLTDADGLTIAPLVFIDVAENTALIRPLGAQMLDMACAQLADWRARLPGMQHITMSVNISALQAQHASLADVVRRVLTEHGLRPSDLVLELTETALLEAANSTLTALRLLRAEGVGIAIDDFGTGYASLRYLATLPVSAVKVDRSFTAGLPQDETCRKIVNAIAGLAVDLNLVCVVEGVETAQQRSALPGGVQIQGWLTGIPAAPHDLDVLRFLLAVV